VLAESLNGQNPTGRLHSEALRHMLWAVPKFKMGIPGALQEDDFVKPHHRLRRFQ